MILASSSIYKDIFSVTVPKHELPSDHFPLTFKLKNKKPELINNKNITKINYENLFSAMENRFKTYFNKKFDHINLSTENLGKILLKNYELSLNENSRQCIKKIDNLNLPKKIISLIREKKEARKQAAKYNFPFFYTRYNLINKILNREILEHKQYINNKKLENLAMTKAKDSKFWKLLKHLEGNQSFSNNTFPYLDINGQKLYDEKSISKAFGENLAKIFVPYTDDSFDNEFFYETNQFCNTDQLFDYSYEEYYDCDFVMVELEVALEQLKIKSAPGPDTVNNRILKNLGRNGKKFLLFLINKSFKENSIPSSWKIAKMKMIPKKPHDQHNINNYRPISLTNSIAKIVERVIKNRLTDFLDSNNLISKYQSGFRANRSSIDNLFFFSQKCLLNFYKKQKIGGIVFDIEKAFDKIWHQGLFLKLHNMRIPTNIAKWIKNFLTDRSFYVSINGTDSELYKIKTGVPQGSILSPTLFSIFINDIPLSLPNYSNLSSVLYADDLFTFYSDKNIKRVQIVLQYYLNNLEKWLLQWRLKISAHKCSYNIYSRSNRGNSMISLKIFNQKIERVGNPRYLGIILDSRLSFSTHIKLLKDRCFRKMNYLRIINHINISNKTKLTVYNAMIRSNMDFAAPIISKISMTCNNKLNSIQYNSLRIILNRKRYKTSHSEMTAASGIKPLSRHINDLKENFIKKALNNNEMIIELREEVEEFLISNPELAEKDVSLFYKNS